MLQRISLADTVALSAGERLSVSGFADDTIVTEALQALAAVAGVEPCWEVEIEKAIPVAAGLGGGSSDAAAALLLANDLLPEPLTPVRLAELAATIGADVPFFLRSGPQLGTADGTVLAPVDLPADYSVVLVVPSSAVKTSTGDVYRAFDAQGRRRGLRGAAGCAARGARCRPAPAGPRRAPAERSRLVARVRAAARGGGIPRRRERRRPLRLRPLRRPGAGRSSGPGVACGGADMGRDAGSASRRDGTRCVYRRGMSGLVVEHRESQFSRRLRRRRVQIAVGIAAVEAVLVVAGVLPWWLVVAAAAGSVALYLWVGRDHALTGRSRGDVARRGLAAHRRARSRRARGRRRPRDRRRRDSGGGCAGRAPARPPLIARIDRAAGYTRRPDSLGRGQVVRQRALVP